MSNNQVKLDFGNVQDVGKSGTHPEVLKRHNEIVQLMRELSDEEHIDALFSFAATKWHRLRNSENPDFRAKSGSLQGEEK